MKGEISMPNNWCPNPSKIEKRCPHCGLALVITKENFEYEGTGAIKIQYARCIRCDMNFTIRENFQLVDRVIEIG
jgi:hypothetical protein